MLESGDPLIQSKRCVSAGWHKALTSQLSMSHVNTTRPEKIKWRVSNPNLGKAVEAAAHCALAARAAARECEGTERVHCFPAEGH